MHEQDPDKDRQNDNDIEREAAPESVPRIYVASLADYNDGRLHGIWLDAAQDVQEMQKQVRGMLDKSPVPHAEEWAIHDYEGFDSWRPDESESFETIARIAAGIVKYGPAFAEWVATIGSTDDIEESFENAYAGEWESGAAFVEESLEDVGALKDIREAAPGNLANYVRIDFSGYFDDLVLSGDLLAIEKPGGGCYIFWNI